MGWHKFNKARNGDYRPGKELIVLAIGLLLFFIGLYFGDVVSIYTKPIYLIAFGIILKILFILKFIQIVQSEKN